MTCHCKRYMGDSTPLSVFLGTLSVTAVLVARFVELPGPTVLQASQSMKQTVGADCPVFQAAQNILALAGTGVGISPAVGPLHTHCVHFFCGGVEACPKCQATSAGGLPLQELHHIEWHSLGHGAASMNVRSGRCSNCCPFPVVPVCP